jgi:hypothetical protein
LPREKSAIEEMPPASESAARHDIDLKNRENEAREKDSEGPLKFGDAMISHFQGIYW